MKNWFLGQQLEYAAESTFAVKHGGIKLDRVRTLHFLSVYPLSLAVLSALASSFQCSQSSIEVMWGYLLESTGLTA